MRDCFLLTCCWNLTDGGFKRGSWRSGERCAPSASHSLSSPTRHSSCVFVQGQFSSAQLAARSHRPGSRVRRRDESIGRAAKWRACHFNWHSRSSVYPRAARAQMRGHGNKTARAPGNNKLVWSETGSQGQRARVTRRGTNEQSRCLLVFSSRTWDWFRAATQVNSKGFLKNLICYEFNC